MLLGLGAVIAGAALLYFAVTGVDPRTLLGPGGGRTPTTVPGPFIGPVGGEQAVSGNITAPLAAAIAGIRVFVATRFPSSRLIIGSTFRPGAIVAGTSSASEHAFGNAVDLRILTSTGALDRIAMDALYNALRLTPVCELCWASQGGCTTSHDDHLHYAPQPCRAG